MFSFLQIYVTTYQTDWKIPKKIPCRIDKVTRGMYVTPPPFRFLRKHHNNAYLKKTQYFCCHIPRMLLHIRKIKKKINCQIYNVATSIFVSTPHHPFCNILTSKIIYVNIYFCCHIYVTTRETNGVKPKKTPYRIHKVATGI